MFLKLNLLLFFALQLVIHTKAYDEDDYNYDQIGDRIIDFRVEMNSDNTSVWIDDKEIYSHVGNKTTRGKSSFQYHTGIHCITLHESTLQVLNKKLFYTAQPSSDRHLLRTLSNTHEDRIIILLGTTNFTFWVREELQEFLYEFGTILGPEIPLGEFWAVVLHKGATSYPKYELDTDFWDDTLTETETQQILQKKRAREQKNPLLTDILVNQTSSSNEYKYIKVEFTKPDEEILTKKWQAESLPLRKKSDFIDMKVKKRYKILYEGISIIRNFKNKMQQSSPLKFSIYISPIKGKKCSWHYNIELKNIKKFCQTYDGYYPFCRCDGPTQLMPRFIPQIKDPMYGVIPVAIVTANRLPQVLRQVRQLRAAPGGGEIPIVLCVDGESSEADSLAKLINITVFYHYNDQKIGTAHRVNSHIRWSLHTLFMWSEKMDSKYGIILEDDLDLAPDFMNYFHQVSWLMDVDKTIVIANAYNYNAYPHSAIDPSRVLLVKSYPYYGWMINKENALKMVKTWPDSNDLQGKWDWDLYFHYYHLNDSYVIIPEVPRTKHFGGGGVHVSGYVQETTYNLRPLNKVKNVNLTLTRLWSKAYIVDRMKFILEAKVINITQSPCKKLPISPNESGKFVMYLNIWGDDDSSKAYFTICRCLGFFEENMLEQIEGTFLKKFYNSDLLLISCPVSPYCNIENKSVIYKPTPEHIKDAELLPFNKPKSSVKILIRVPAAMPLREMLLKNLIEATLYIAPTISDIRILTRLQSGSGIRIIGPSVADCPKTFLPN